MRSEYPGLPYVKVQQARSGPTVDPARVQLASRMEALEAELRGALDRLERLQGLRGQERAIKDLQRRVAFIERQLAIEPDYSPQPADKPAAQSPPSPIYPPIATAPGPAAQAPPPELQSAQSQEESPARPAQVIIRNKPMTTDEQAFREAYAPVRNGRLQDAEPLMRDFLKQYKESKYASNAVYWIGEALFARGKFNEAVLEFDKVIKEYPGSEKELSALLKQGMAFEKMGDTASARILYEKLIKNYPHTAQARLAKSHLTTGTKKSAGER